MAINNWNVDFFGIGDLYYGLVLGIWIGHWDFGLGLGILNRIRDWGMRLGIGDEDWRLALGLLMEIGIWIWD